MHQTECWLSVEHNLLALAFVNGGIGSLAQLLQLLVGIRFPKLGARRLRERETNMR